MTRSEEAFDYIKIYCPGIGSFAGDSTPYKFLCQVADEMEASRYTELFPERYKGHVAYAVGMVARYTFLESPAAIAAVYLATRFEFFFRLLSGKLKGDGTWLSPADQQAAIAALGKKGLDGKRVSNVAKAYKLMKLDQQRPVARVFNALDQAIFPVPIIASDGSKVADIGDRIAFGRHSTGHGLWGDISSEAVFYGLVTAIIFYNQQL